MTHIYALKHAPNHILESGVGSQQPLDFAGKQMLAKLINPNKYSQTPLSFYYDATKISV